MINYPIIKIPKKYWLDVNLFNYETFDYDDIRCIYNSPRILINDFEFKESDAIEINEFLKLLLEYNPQTRISALNCLKHSWLNN